MRSVHRSEVQNDSALKRMHSLTDFRYSDCEGVKLQLIFEAEFYKFTSCLIAGAMKGVNNSVAQDNPSPKRPGFDLDVNEIDRARYSPTMTSKLKSIKYVLNDVMLIFL